LNWNSDEFRDVVYPNQRVIRERFPIWRAVVFGVTFDVSGLFSASAKTVSRGYSADPCRRAKSGQFCGRIAAGSTERQLNSLSLDVGHLEYWHCQPNLSSGE
jgi:hypothetical protein